MVRITGEYDERKALAWLAERGVRDPEDTGAAFIAVLKDGEPQVIFAFHDWRQMEHGSVIECSMASDNPRCVTRNVLYEAFRYPFGQLGVVRLQARTAESNRRCIRFLVGVGFVEEGVLRGGWDGRESAIMYSMLPAECRWYPATSQPRPSLWSESLPASEPPAGFPSAFESLGV